MADEFKVGSNWLDNSRNRNDSGTSLRLSTEILDCDVQSSNASGGDVGAVVLTNRMMALALSSPAMMDWNQNQPLLGEKSESSFGSMLEEISLSSDSSSSNLHFTHNNGISTPFWSNHYNNNASAGSTFLPPLQTDQISSPPYCFDDHKPENTSEAQGLNKNNTDHDQTSNKRPSDEPLSPMPPLKVRKEKMGDKITAIQQLVSPFGKTDTASVLFEAIEYIKFLHEHVNALCSPYMKNGAPMQHQQNSDKLKVEGGRQDLRSRGLCLVPVSMAHETTVDFWTRTFEGSFR